jgi:23S rRNA (uracil747-C5)-methyltransferase
MNVSGSVTAPIIGVIRADRTAVDLVECLLTPPAVQDLLKALRTLIQAASLPPYDIDARRGELKNIIVMSNRDTSQAILRFVLRSSEAIPRLRKHVADIQREFPWITVISCNIQPIPAAILEGEEEIILTSSKTIEERYGDITLSFAPQSFMQVTHDIAEALYGRAAKYVRERTFSKALDLFCGVGGFSLSVAPFVKAVTGVELSKMAIESATVSAKRLGYAHSSFVADDAERFLEGNTAGSYDLVITNPPRRGLSPKIIERLQEIAPSAIVYSSCNPETFARDCAALSKEYTLARICIFDMFAMTEHCEVLGFLERH